jgi:hypothetical protein
MSRFHQPVEFRDPLALSALQLELPLLAPASQPRSREPLNGNARGFRQLVLRNLKKCAGGAALCWSASGRGIGRGVTKALIEK